MYYRREFENKKNKKLSKICGYASGAWYNEELGRYIRIYRRQISKQLKIYCNRCYRHKKIDILGKSNIHKKYTEFWWEYD